VRSPEVLFRAAEMGVPAFGANISNGALLAALKAQVDASGLTWIHTAAVTRIVPTTTGVLLELAEGSTVAAGLAVAADGRNSLAPAAAGIAVRTWQYPQVAIVASFSHSRPHDGIVNELHRRSGPLTTVPLPGLRSSLVWAEEPTQARQLAALDDLAFAEVLERRLQGILGSITKLGPRALYPLSGTTVARMGARHIALVGEAAHVIPPIGAQGLNLGLRDAAQLAETASDARAHGTALGSDAMLDAYHRARGTDVSIRSSAIDLLNRSLLLDFPPADLLRGAALHAIATSSTLRRRFMQEGMGTAGNLPLLMRPSAQAAST
jgi:2-octaprenyl-6-methoxyphenol hydroxylase